MGAECEARSAECEAGGARCEVWDEGCGVRGAKCAGVRSIERTSQFAPRTRGMRRCGEVRVVRGGECLALGVLRDFVALLLSLGFMVLLLFLWGGLGWR